MSSDLRPFVAEEIRLHPRVAYQGILSEEGAATRVAASLPPLARFRHDYAGAISVVDWDHRLPSQNLVLRIYGYYGEDTLDAGHEAFDDRLEQIAERDKYPEFDVPDFDGLAEAWRLAAPRVPAARLLLVGRGTLQAVVERLVAELPGQTAWTPRLQPAEVARALDDSSLLLLPSRSEGMGRVVIEALCRGRPILGARVGGIRDLVRDGENGVLVEPEPAALADALVRLLGDRAELERLAAASRPSAALWTLSPEDFAERQVEAVERTLAQ